MAAAFLVTCHLSGVFFTQNAAKIVIRWEEAFASLNSRGFQVVFKVLIFNHKA